MADQRAGKGPRGYWLATEAKRVLHAAVWAGVAHPICNSHGVMTNYWTPKERPPDVPVCRYCLSEITRLAVDAGVHV